VVIILTLSLTVIKLCILLAECIHVFRMILRINSDYFIWSEVLTAVSMKMAVFWIVAPCKLHRQDSLRPDDGGSTDL
jgi:hypothetical protein